MHQFWSSYSAFTIISNSSKEKWFFKITWPCHMTEITWFWELFNVRKRWCGIFFLSFHNIHCTKCFGSFCYLILLNRALLSLVCDKAISWFIWLENTCTVCDQRFPWTSGFRRPLWEFAQLRHSLVYQVLLAQCQKCPIYKGDDVAYSFVYFTTFTVPDALFFCYLDLVN